MFTFQTIETLAMLLLDTAAKATVLLSLTCVIAWLLRRTSAALKHSIWSLSLLALILLPAASWMLPSWRIPILPAVQSPELAIASIATDTNPSSRTSDLPRSARQATARRGRDSGHFTSNRTTQSREGLKHSFPPSSPQQPNLKTLAAELPVNASGEMREPVSTTATESQEPNDQIATGTMLVTRKGSVSIIALFWILGVAVFGALLATSVWRTLNFRRRSRPVHDPVWCRLLTEMSQRLQLRQSVELREYDGPIVPLTWGVIRPVVLVPRKSRKWSESMQRVNAASQCSERFCSMNSRMSSGATSPAN
jgi:beta-lactamase regulating signal transducer with metallopeptidase domain